MNVRMAERALALPAANVDGIMGSTLKWSLAYALMRGKRCCEGGMGPAVSAPPAQAAGIPGPARAVDSARLGARRRGICLLLSDVPMPLCHLSILRCRTGRCGACAARAAVAGGGRRAAAAGSRGFRGESAAGRSSIRLDVCLEPGSESSRRSCFCSCARRPTLTAFAEPQPSGLPSWRGASRSAPGSAALSACLRRAPSARRRCSTSRSSARAARTAPWSTVPAPARKRTGRSTRRFVAACPRPRGSRRTAGAARPHTWPPRPSPRPAAHRGTASGRATATVTSRHGRRPPPPRAPPHRERVPLNLDLQGHETHTPPLIARRSPLITPSCAAPAARRRRCPTRPCRRP
jgi:hypothetical protein